MSPLRRLAVAISIVVATAAAGWYGWAAWDRYGDVQVTEDAYVRGEITILAPRVAGYAVEILADDNSRVAAHQTLVRLDPRDFRSAVLRAEAALELARAGAARVEVSRDNQLRTIEAANAALQAARAQAQRNRTDLGRAQDLRQGGFGTQARLDDAMAANQATASAVLQAESTRALQVQTLAAVDADARVAAANIVSAEASLATARIALEDTEVWAPIAGTVANRRTRVGEYVVPGTRLLSIVPSTGLWIEANFRETQVARMQPGQAVAIQLDMHPARPVCGYVEGIGAASGSEFALVPPDNATGNFTKIVRRFPVRIRPSPNDGNAELMRPGMSTRVRVALAAGTSVACPGGLPSEADAPRPTRLAPHPGLGNRPDAAGQDRR